MKVQDVVQFMTTNFPCKYYPNGFPAESQVDCGTVKLMGGNVEIYIPQLKKASIQVLIRAKRPQEAETKALEVYDGLNGKEFFNMGATYVAFCLADQAVPIHLGKDENGFTIYSLNFTCKVKD